MESRKFSFNLSMIRRDVKKHWPVWAVTCLCLLLVVTALISMLSFTFRNNDLKEIYVTKDILEMLMMTSCYFSPILGIIVALCAFGFLGKKKKHFFYEALPLSRFELFGTKYIFGVIVLLIPNIMIYLVEILQDLSLGGHGFIQISGWLIVAIVQYLFWFSMAVFCIVCCGRILMAIVCYVAASVYVPLMEAIVSVFAQIGYAGVEYRSARISFMPLQIISPIEFFEEMTDYAFLVDDYNNIRYFPEDCWLRVIIAFVAVIILVALAIKLFSRRKAEKTDENAVFGFTRIIFSWCFSFTFTTLLVIFFSRLFFTEQFCYFHNMVECIIIVIWGILLGFVGYLASCMILEKRFNVFKHNLKKILIFIAAYVAFLFIMIFDLFGTEKYVPDVEAFDEGSVYFDYEGYRTKYVSDKSGKEKMTELHRIIIDNFEEVFNSATIRDMYSYTYVYDYDNYTFLELTYYLDDKADVGREYRIKKGSNLEKKVIEFLKENEQFFNANSTRYENFEPDEFG